MTNSNGLIVTTSPTALPQGVAEQIGCADALTINLSYRSRGSERMDAILDALMSGLHSSRTLLTECPEEAALGTCHGYRIMTPLPDGSYSLVSPGGLVEILS